MRVFMNCLVALAALIVISTTTPADELSNSDTRLSAKVTVDCGSTRLYSAINRISRETGVVISSGKSEEDWKARDIPVIICSRDLPLGVLLTSIADATHLLVSSRLVDGEKRYRVWRDLKREKELAALDEWYELSTLYEKAWIWDAMSQAADLPDSAFSTDPDKADLIPAVRALSNLLDQLGPEVRDRYLTGQRILLSPTQVPGDLQAYVADMIRAYWKDAYLPVEELTDETLNRCWIDMRPEGTFSVEVHSGGKYKTYRYMDVLRAVGTDYGLPTITEYLTPDWNTAKPNRPGYPPPIPTIPSKPNTRCDDLGSRYTRLLLNSKDSALLDTEVKLDAMKDIQKPTYADLLARLCTASGYSVVAEAYACRQIQSLPTSGQVQLRDILARAMGLDWYLDEQNNIILGRDPIWTVRVKRLVPEKSLKNLADKLRTDGVDLEDLAALAGLTEDQILEWIGHCPEYPGVSSLYTAACSINKGSLWGFYFSLDPKDRAAARSGQSVVLTSYDQQWLGSLIYQRFCRETLMSLFHGRPIPQWYTISQGLLEPGATPEVQFRLSRTDKPDSRQHVYRASLRWPVEGGVEEIQDELPGSYPMSPAEAENKPE